MVAGIGNQANFVGDNFFKILLAVVEPRAYAPLQRKASKGNAELNPLRRFAF